MPTCAEYFKYTEDKWLARRSSTSWLGLGGGGGGGGGGGERVDASSTTNHSIWSVHSCVEEKNRVLRTLTQFGIETTVDRTAKKQRIRDWILHASGSSGAPPRPAGDASVRPTNHHHIHHHHHHHHHRTLGSL